MDGRIPTPETLVLPPSAMNDETRAELRTAALESTYFMAKSIIGFRDLTPGLHWEMCKWIENGSTHKHGVVPRDHLKTSIWTISDTTRRICKDPNIRILLGNETATNASHFLRRIEAIWDRNQVFRWVFPEIIWWDESKRRKWSETEMEVPRSIDYNESTVESMGVGGAAVSRHYNLIKLDDLVGKEASESAEVMRKTIDWYQYAESLLDHPVLSEIQNFGTPWGIYDLHQWILEHEKDHIDFFFRQCYGADGEPIWKERFTREALERIRKKIGPFKFSCQYECRPHDPESGGFAEKDLGWWEWKEGKIAPQSGDGSTRIDLSELEVYARVDPAISEKRGSARTAVVVDGVHESGRIFLLEAWAQRCDPFKMIEKLFDLAEQYDLISIGIEAVAYQRILKPVIEQEAERRKRWLNIVEFKPDTGTRKENRIYGKFSPVLRRNRYWVNRDIHEDWLNEFKAFPNGQVCDLMDATAYGDEQWEINIDSDDTPEEQAAYEMEEEQAAERAMSGANEYTGY